MARPQKRAFDCPPVLLVGLCFLMQTDHATHAGDPTCQCKSMHDSVCEYALLIERVMFMQTVIFVTVLAGYTLFLHERLAFDVRASLG